ncbi:MAG: HRDC domain-containing protein [Alphaproteobacteria bacterium]|nr:HRDC domain-containing protein [Alphaproteobacteria bacterium]
MEYKFVENQTTLDAYINEIKNYPYIAVDTEFIRNNTYYPKLSLVQICFKPQFAIVIDCLSIKNLEPLIEVIYNPNIIKVFHSARQDLEIFYNKRGDLPKNIFDTQIAVMLINFAKDTSYEKMIKALLNIDIDKSLTNSDWLQRPLLLEQIQYAANDVLYLFEAYQIILKLLEKHQHLHWLENLFAPLTDPKTFENRITKDITKLSRDFSVETLPLIYDLLIWREMLAKKLDLPRNNVLDIDIIKEIAKKQPANKNILREILRKEIDKKQLDEIFSIITSKRSLPLTIEKTPSLNQNQTEIYNILKIILSNSAIEQKVNEHLIASSEELIDFIINKENSSARFLHGWRFDIFGNKAIDFLNEEKSIKIRDNKVILE